MKTIINASIYIENGKIVQIGLKKIVEGPEENLCSITTHMNTFEGLLITQSIINEAVNNFEKENQRSFIPDENTIYNLPKDE